MGPRKKRAEQEIELWRVWHAEPKDTTLTPLLDSLQNLVDRRVGEFRGAAVPPAAIKGFAEAQVMKALNNYDPDKGTQLSTYVNWHLKKVRSFVVKHQNVGRVPDHRAYNITAFKQARTELEERLGHPPDTLSLAEQLGWSQAEVGRMEAELRADHIASRSPEPDTLTTYQSVRERDVLRYIHEDLTPDERSVLEYSMGLYGKPQLSAQQIASTMGISAPKVSRIRAKIDKKLRERGDLMALSADTIARLEELKVAVEEYFDELLAEIDAQAEFLRGADVSLSSTSESAAESATDMAQDTIDSIKAV